MYGLTGSVPAIASRMPPTAETNPKAADSSGTDSGPVATRIAAAAGVTRSAITSRAPMMWTATATISPSRSMNPNEIAVTGTPRAAADCGSRESKRSGCQMSRMPARTSTLIAISQPSCPVCTDTICPVSRLNRFALRPL